jgi:hypothetical protein
MNQIGGELLMNGLNLPNGLCRPESRLCRINLAQMLNIGIVAGVKPHMMTILSKQTYLGIHHGVFAATVQIAIVRNQYSHRKSSDR